VSATCTTLRKGETEPVSRTFTLDLAQKAGLLSRSSSPWKTYPDRMMQMRARAWCLRDTYADALMGIQSAEEIRDIEYQGVIPEIDTPLQVNAPAQIAPPIELSFEEASEMMSKPEDMAALIKNSDLIAKASFTEEQRDELRNLFKVRRDQLKAAKQESDA
jgi:hypothetical protein